MRIHPEFDWRNRYNEVKGMTDDERRKLAEELGCPSSDVVTIVAALNVRDYPELRS